MRRPRPQDSAAALPLSPRKLRSLRALVLVLLSSAAVASSCGGAQLSAARIYYVCNDSSCPNAAHAKPGSRGRPWRTIGRVNRQRLRAGDTVLLKGGDTFGDQTLEPASSGAAGAPVVYGSYGAGHAILKRGVWIPSHRRWVTVENLTVDGNAEGGPRLGGMQGIAGAAAGYDTHISVLDNTLRNLAIGINAETQDWAFGSDNHWLISGNTIDRTGDSGIIVLGNAFTIVHNTIEHTGLDYTYFGEHGVYLKATNSNVSDNTITRFRHDGVSVRYRNSRIEGNTIQDGEVGIAWFQDDRSAGTSIWRDNAISHTTGDSFYVSPADAGGHTRESFVIADNTMSKDAGSYMALKPTRGTYTVTDNTSCIAPAACRPFVGRYES